MRDVRIQLPSSERAFLFGEEVRTSLLGKESGAVDGRTEAQSKRNSTAVLDPMNGYHPTASSGRFSTYDTRYTNGDVRGRDDEPSVRWELGAEEGVVSRFVRITELYGMVAKWSCGGGRRYDLTQFSTLNVALELTFTGVSATRLGMSAQLSTPCKGA